MIERSRAAERILAAVGLGVLLGVFSSQGDGLHVMVLNGLANAASPWIVVAFASGAVQQSWRLAMGCGALSLVIAAVVYYGAFLVAGYGFLLPFLAAWAIAGAGVGILFGLCGFAWHTRRDRWRLVAVALLCGALLAEAADRLILLQVWTGIEWDRTYMQVAVADLLAALASVLLLVARRRWAATAAMAIPAGAIGLVAFLAADNLRFG